MRRASSDFLPNDLAFATRAGFAVLLEDPQVALVLARMVQHILVQPYGRPPVLDPCREVFENRRVEPAPLLTGDRVGFTPGMQRRVVEDLVHVNITDTSDYLLVQQQGFYLRSEERRVGKECRSR